ncbi:MAG: response regulator transcription factor [Pseudomonadota bacterium]
MTQPIDGEVASQPQSALVVEDDESIAKLLVGMLELQGFSVRLAADGREAVAEIRDGKPVDVAILDIMLPFVDGFELVTLIRSQAAWKDTRIMMLSARTQASDVGHALAAGANDYMTKPFNPEELVSRIARLKLPSTQAGDLHAVAPEIFIRAA